MIAYPAVHYLCTQYQDQITTWQDNPLAQQQPSPPKTREQAVIDWLIKDGLVSPDTTQDLLDSDVAIAQAVCTDRSNGKTKSQELTNLRSYYPAADADKWYMISTQELCPQYA